MAEETVSLTYRELAERLAITTDAARMKARRAVQKGRWRIIEGNHPNDPVRVEMPLTDAGSPNAIGGERKGRSTGERKGRTIPRTDTDTLALALQSTQARIAELTDQLTAEKDQHRDTAVELAKAITKAEFLDAELVIRMAELEQLQEELKAARRSWWQRMTGR
jgi:hypothetical protein